MIPGIVPEQVEAGGQERLTVKGAVADFFLLEDRALQRKNIAKTYELGVHSRSRGPFR